MRTKLMVLDNRVTRSKENLASTENFSERHLSFNLLNTNYDKTFFLIYYKIIFCIPTEIFLGNKQKPFQEFKPISNYTRTPTNYEYETSPCHKPITRYNE